MKSQRVYCQHILERIQQIERFTAEGETAFLADDRTQEAVIRCFEVIGEAVKRLDTTFTARYEAVSWRGFSGFRDVLIHQYDDIDMMSESITLKRPRQPAGGCAPVSDTAPVVYLKLMA